MPERHPDIEVTVLSGIPGLLLRARTPVAFDHVTSTDDFGLLMRSPMELLRQA